jgi:hypothetical protein
VFFVIGLFRHGGSGFEFRRLLGGLGYYLLGGCGVRGDDFRLADNALVMGVCAEAD